MPRVSNVPKFVNQFLFHGVDLEWEGKEQAQGDCPLCGREGRFYVNPENGLWDCKFCTARGNVLTFLRQFWELCDKAPADYEPLRAGRNLLSVETLRTWGVVKSVLLDEYLVPGYDREGKIVHLYRYSYSRQAGRWFLRAMPDVHHGIFGANLYNPQCTRVFLFEGIWDGMAAWEVMRAAKVGKDGLVQTSNEDASLLADVSVLATPSTGVFNESWGPLFAGRAVSLFYDNDHPVPHPQTGQPSEPGAWGGMKKASVLLARAEEPPSSIYCIRWHPEANHNPELPNRYDVRDHLAADNASLQERIGRLEQLINLTQPIPGEWLEGRSLSDRKKGRPVLELLPCHEWSKLINQWRKAMQWTEGLDKALACMLASVTSTESVGDQLWMRIMGPASCGKSTLCEALSANRKYVVAKSTMRGFHSGSKTDKDGAEDHSLLTKLNNKTLVTKDGDTLLSSPNMGQILAEARDIYDRVSRSHYRHGISRDYEGLNMTWLLCGTSSLRQLDQSELGERFLSCTIMEEIDEDLEDEVILRVVYAAEQNMGLRSNGRPEEQDDPDKIKAKQLTGGYITHLRENAQDLLAATSMTEEQMVYCGRLGKFVAFMRARPSKKQREAVEREFAARLASQMIRLAKCLAVVKCRGRVDDDVIAVVRSVALDSAHGIGLDVARRLHGEGRSGAETKVVAIMINQPDEETYALLKFMRKIKVVESFVPQMAPGVKGRLRWRLTERFALLYDAVMGV